jgi:hypothetical protein
LENIRKEVLLKRVVRRFLKWGVVSFVILSSALALHIQHSGDGFDPVRIIQSLRDQNRRDDALDLVEFVRQNQIVNNIEIEELENDLEYTATEKLKSFGWEGFSKGNVCDFYSGLGAMSSDLCVYGDIRDIGIHSWKAATDNPTFDKVVLILSAVGLVLSTKPAWDVIPSLLKNTVKYIGNIPKCLRTGLLEKFLLGKLSRVELFKVFDLFKKRLVHTTHGILSFKNR